MSDDVALLIARTRVDLRISARCWTCGMDEQDVDVEVMYSPASWETTMLTRTACWLCGAEVREERVVKVAV